MSLALSTTLVENGMGPDAELRCEGEKGRGGQVWTKRLAGELSGSLVGKQHTSWCFKEQLFRQTQGAKRRSAGGESGGCCGIRGAREMAERGRFSRHLLDCRWGPDSEG